MSAPKKRFGQHFLHDQAVLDRIVRTVNPKPDDALVEIGPGRGALTRLLLPKVTRLRVVEIDRDVIAPLRAACGQSEKLEIHMGDALEVDFAQFVDDGRPLRLVGNLPYNISTPLLFHLLGVAGLVKDMHFMLQKEVVDRLCAEPGSDDYGRLTVSMAARAAAVSLFDVGPEAFHPPPKVDSAVVRLTPRPAPFPLADLGAYERLVAAAFNQRRKTLANGLKGLLTAAQIAAVGIEPGIRAEQLSPAEFARLSDAWASLPAA
ncbi:16S rRNA (adenine(1518)-N(6)/adenine(1519)-N(6))-dimethyltransferase RsmA [uncultured Nevskia sp.]|uniref:16S rRNA (adenine(1518)-N(6)/adenine(1519)-N(6))- dimethyltransferase RsmA n=1 Tax=uncultured Nevskia sp. TaxID=228950 RepID=UPI0025DAFD25|nr:16S rRNA (adenine(1518)-N(6)/adenine(1519)-N(6))-dimethyltransferase RsmA [uncultured Nevskia sp.]